MYEYRGNISDVCAAVGIGRTQFYKWIKDDPDFAAAVDNVDEFRLDYVESKMFDRIDEGSDNLIKFYLSTRGKKRGYVEKNELDMKVTVGKEAEQENYE